MAKKKQQMHAKSVFSLLFGKLSIVILLMLVQLAILLVAIILLGDHFVAVYGFLTALSVTIAVWLVSKDENPAYKLAWIIPILIFPIFGGLFYLMFGNKSMPKKLARRITLAEKSAPRVLAQDASCVEELREADPGMATLSDYILRTTGSPLWKNTQSEYLPIGETMWARMLEELPKAKRFIFMEYFILEEGVMWEPIFQILREKAAEGVDVRFMYDDLGSIMTLPANYAAKLRKAGIKCALFNPFQPHLNSMMNYRDHRKITVIDGDVGFCGGINIADEYINDYEKHGHWKDAAVMLRGDAVWSLATMFLTMWDSISDEELSDPERYRPLPEELPGSFSGIVQPYADSPLDRDLVGEMVYLNIINRAQRYLYICTPYLIVDNETLTALLLAAKSGVDVRIITPHIGDKWYVHLLTRACYPQLVRGGVKIYEYTPGFIHSKTFVSDDEVATVGTINLDYRSLYLHFECGLWMAHSSCISAVRDDFLETLRVCEQVTLDSPFLKLNGFERLLRAVLRIFAPLM